MGGPDAAEAMVPGAGELEEEEYHKVAFPEYWARYLMESLPVSLEAAQQALAALPNGGGAGGNNNAVGGGVLGLTGAAAAE